MFMGKFNDESFWAKVRRLVGQLPFAKDVVAAYYAMTDASTPVWAKATLAGAILYFMTPLDAVPDFIPGLGYGDDAAAMTAALAVVDGYVTDEHKRKAEDFFRQ